MNDIIIAISGVLIGSLVTVIITRLLHQKQLADTKTGNEPSEYWRGRMDAFYVVLELLQEKTEEQ